MTPKSPDVSERPFELSLGARRGSVPSIGELRGAFEQSPEFVVHDGAGLEYQNRQDGSWPADTPPGFRADSVDPSTPIVVAYLPEQGDGGDDSPAFALTMGFGDDPDAIEMEYSVSQMWVHVAPEDEVVRRAIERLDAVLAPFGLYLAADAAGLPEEHDDDADSDEEDHDERADWMLLSPASMTEAWVRAHERILDVEAESAAGMYAADRVYGITQQTFLVVGLVGDRWTVRDAIDVDREDHICAIVDGGATLLLAGRRVALPTGTRWTGVRWRPGGGVVVFGVRDDVTGVALQVGPGGDVEAEHVGEVHCPDVVTERYLVNGYGDESIFSGDEIEENGIAAFEYDGSFAFGYQRDITEPVDISDCYALAFVEADVIAFCAYTDFELVTVDLATQAQTVHPTPRPHGFGALSVRDGVAYFHSPYDDDAGLYRWDIGAASMTRVGRHPGLLRGLPGGRFLTVGPGGCTVVTPD